ncbi:MAG: hypothetical protein J6I55_05510 [Ruminococcus sp.]|nr:hypothetical protein [Ruminococcus sp.]
MKTEKNRKLKGTVLLAVVATMALLIIFMGTTLILASAANNRAHKTYATSQAEYTAQAAIKAFTTALEDKDNPSMIAAVQQLGSPTYPDVVINNTAVGHVGYYESDGTWVENKIKVEPLGEAPNFVYGIKTFGSDPEWYKPDRYRITATARVGRDEKTVSLYLTSMPLDGDDPKTIEGFQTIGDSSFDATQDEFNGALVVGIKKDGEGTYGLNNQTKVNCNYVFVNGTLNVPGQGQINVNTDKFKMTVTGNMKIQNDNFMNINYTASTTPEAKDIPYMFVDGKIDGEGSFVKIKGTGAPFNVFAGNVNLPKVDMDANLYLMDSGVTNILGQDGSKLYKWSSSVVNGTDQNLGEGGSLYSMGSVKTGINGVKFDGDVRVAENLEISGGLEVGGNLIVGGILAHNGTVNVSGNIYCDHVGTLGGLKTGYTIEDVMTEVHAADIRESNVETIEPSTVGYAYNYIHRDPVNGNILAKDWRSTPYYVYYDHINGSYIKYSGDNNPYYGYYDPADDSLIEYKGDNNPYEIESVYKDPSGNRVSEFDAKEFTEATPPININGKPVKPLSDMMGDLGYDDTNIYPQSMTREKIYMLEDPVGSGNWVDAPEDTKFIKTISDIQNAVGMNPTTGALPYPSAPTEGKNIDEYDKYTTGGDYNGSNLNPAISEGGAITKSCIIDTTINSDLEIYAKDSDIWVILADGVRLNEKTVTVKSSPYTVKFFVAGFFDNFKGVIKNEKADNHYKWDERMNIEWYGATGSVINFNNNGTICGAARAPYTTIQANVNGVMNIEYEDEYGNTRSMTPCWIGNALFNDAKVSNNFSIAYTLAGGGGSTTSLGTALGDYELSYFAEY